MADCCFSAERQSVDAGMTSQVARSHVVPLRAGKGAADRRRSSPSGAVASSTPPAALAAPGGPAVSTLTESISAPLARAVARLSPSRRPRFDLHGA